MNRKRAAEIQALAFQEAIAAIGRMRVIGDRAGIIDTPPLDGLIQAANDLVTRMRAGTIVDQEEIESATCNLDELVAEGPRLLQEPTRC
jgi:hypothetical protein